ncbi:topoisomerase I [Bacillus cereus]|uniref:topoisomerase I n=1 Tax=Bacillus cereus TaxID=1396 RepID=UPI000BF29ECE|nr:topoisomerase I [Bacillus cereus]PFX70630.1 topoisomerase I [Bacillus cereus]
MAVTIGNRTYRNIEQWQVDFIVKHADRKLKDIGKEINLDERRVGEILKLLGIKRTRHRKIYLPKTAEVEQELKNPYLPHVEIAIKYGVSDTCVAKRRKELNVKVRKKNYDTLLEQQVEQMLLSLDLAFIKQKRIDKWSIDFYLGRKYCLDVHGKWAHSLKKIKERDKRKLLFMEEGCYKYFVIHEEELANKEKVLQKIKEFTMGFPC